MTDISIELVPRSAESILADVKTIRSEFPRIDTVNVPDLLRFGLRSWEACAIARSMLPRAIPHLRAMDFDLKSLSRFSEGLSTNKISEVLVVRGDTPQEIGHRVYATTASQLVGCLKKAIPKLRIYAAFDPYRRGLRSELEHTRAKVDAGADGFFTQPFFDLRLQEVCADLLVDREVYWGVSPVLVASARRYWEVKNQVFFPSDFEPTLSWNRQFAARTLAWAKERSANLYFMPIRVGLKEYLGGLL